MRGHEQRTGVAQALGIMLAIPLWAGLAAVLWSMRWIYLSATPAIASVRLLVTLWDYHAYLKKKESFKQRGLERMVPSYRWAGGGSPSVEIGL
jgi:hypothetical protein